MDESTNVAIENIRDVRDRLLAWSEYHRRQFDSRRLSEMDRRNHRNRAENYEKLADKLTECLTHLNDNILNTERYKTKLKQVSSEYNNAWLDSDADSRIRDDVLKDIIEYIQ